MRNVTLILAIVMAWPAYARDDVDPMAFQRCIWRCLASDGPADNPAYQACVDRVCATGETATATAPAPPAWTAGVIDGGRTRYAGADLPNGLRGVYYFCDRRGRSSLMIAGVAERRATWSLEFGLNGASAQERISEIFAPVRNGVSVELAPTHPVFEALRDRSRVRVRSGDGRDVFTLSLAGSSVALAETMQACS